MGGHLITIAHRNENSIVKNLGGTGERWIGLTDSEATSLLDGFDLSTLGTSEAGGTSGLALPPAGVEPGIGQRGAGFKWITGEPYTFLNWRNGAPGDLFGQADGVYTIAQGVWQDNSAGASVGQPGIAGPAIKKYVVEYDTLLDQNKFHFVERQAAASFNSGTGNIVTIAQVDALLGLPLAHPDVAGQEITHPFVISFHDPDLGGGLLDYARAPFAVNEFGPNEDNFALQATAQVIIPSSGDWTFGVMAGDKFRLTVGGNEFAGDGVLQTGPPRLTRTGQGALTAAPGGSGDTFFFAAAGVYDLNLTSFESDFAAFIQMFAAPGNLGAFDTATFDLVGDEFNGGLRLVPEPSALLMLVVLGGCRSLARRQKRAR